MGWRDKEEAARMKKKYGQKTAPKTEKARAKAKAETAKVMSMGEARHLRYSNKLAGGDKMWGYKSSDIDMSGYADWAKKGGGYKTNTSNATKGRDKQTSRTKRTKAMYLEEQAYAKAKKENKFGLTDHIAKLKEESSGPYYKKLAKAAYGAAKTVAPYAALAVGGAGLAGFGPAAGLLGGAGAATGAASAATPMGSGFLGIGPGVASMGAGGAAAAGGGAAALSNAVAGNPMGSGFAGVGPGVASTAAAGGGMGTNIMDGIKSFGSGLVGGDKDIWGSLLNYGLSSYANSQSSDDIQAGFEQTNPWSKHQGAMGDRLMGLINDPSSIRDTPGYQFQYDQGMEAMNAKNASQGNRYSGRAMEEAGRFGTGLADQMYNQEMNRYASLAGANVPNQGNTGGDQSQIGQQQSYNTGYFLNSLFGNKSAAPSVTDQSTGGGGVNYNTELMT